MKLDYVPPLSDKKYLSLWGKHLKPSYVSRRYHKIRENSSKMNVPMYAPHVCRMRG